MAKQIAGIQLSDLLQSLPQNSQIKVVRPNHPARKMHVGQVIVLVKAIAFVGVMSGTRLRHVREVERPEPQINMGAINMHAALPQYGTRFLGA